MPWGEGEFNALADAIVRGYGAKGAIVIIVGPLGHPRDGHAVSFHDEEHFRRVPEILRQLATQIEGDLARMPRGGGKA